MSYSDTVLQLKNDFFGSSDLVGKEYTFGEKKGFLYYIEQLVDMEQLERGLIAPLSKSQGFTSDVVGLGGVVSCVADMKVLSDYQLVPSLVASGSALLILEDSPEFFLFSVQKRPHRPVAEPPTSPVIKGPREGFTEELPLNLALLRKKIRSNKLVFKKLQIGRFSETSVCIAYIKGISDEKIVSNVFACLSSIDIDGITDSSNLVKYLEGRNYSLFKQIGNTEKPDILANKMMEGRIAVFVDGSPIVLTLPFLFMEDYRDVQDGYKRTIRATFLRVIRLCAIAFALILPAVFVALQTYQFQMLPTNLLIAIINAEQGIPFEPIIEMLVALVLFEILAEASIRMPRYVGMALSVVGALVLGDTAVKAGLLSSITVLIVALSGIGLYAMPDEAGMLSTLRMLFAVVAGVLGIFGLVLLSVCIFSYLVTLESYGVPYLAPFAPIIGHDLKDSVVKQAITSDFRRPVALNNYNQTKQTGADGYDR